MVVGCVGIPYAKTVVGSVLNMDHIRQVYEKIDAILDDEKYAEDHRLFSKLCIDFCGHLLSSMDADGLKALQIAKDFWSGKIDEHERLEGLSLISPRLNSYTPNSPENAVNRLVFGALSDVNGLNWQAGEFLVDMAADAGIPLSSIADIFSENLPEFSKAR